MLTRYFPLVSNKWRADIDNRGSRNSNRWSAGEQNRDFDQYSLHIEYLLIGKKRSFTEYLSIQKLSVPDQEKLTPQGMGMLLNHLNAYLLTEGFPEIVLHPSLLRNYLSTLFDSVLLKDILKRFQIRQTQQLYDLANYLLTNYTNPYSYNQLKTDLNFSSVATVQKFIGYLSEPYLFLNLTRYATKIKLQQKSPKKSYVIDTGFIHARSFELSPNYGRLLENVVFIELLRRELRPELDLFYYRARNDKEIDFVCRKGYQTDQLIQVCSDFQDLYLKIR